MKRDHKPKYDGLFPVFTLFEWKQCCKCGQDFRRERGWQFWTGPFYAGRGGLKYLCRECAPTEEAACEITKLFRGIPPEVFDYTGAIDKIPKPTIQAYAELMCQRGDE